jgi:hypothetical protein
MVDSSQSAFDDHRRLLDSKTVTNVERSIRNFKKGRKRGKATRFHQAVVESKELEHEHELELLHGGAQHIQQQQQHKVERVAIGIASPAFQCLKREVKFSYRKEYFQRFCDLLKDVIEFPPTIINTNSINSLEDWHKTIDGFSEMKSCKSAKKKLGRQLEKGKSAKEKVLRNDSSCDDNNSTNSNTADNKTTTSTTTPNQKLQLLYEEFIREVIIPHLQEAMESEMVQQSSPCCISNNNNNNNNRNGHEHERTVDVEVETEFFVQAKPCIRFQQPSNKRTTIPHCDSFYGHQPGQINFWLPLTRSFGSNSLYSESEPGKRDFHSFDCNLNLVNNNNNNNNHLLGDSVNGGHQEQSKICDCDNDNDNNDNDNGKMTIDTGNVTEMMRFYGNECVHFTEANRTEITRVSLDFRVVPGFVYDNDYVGSRHSENGRQLFKAAPEGEYYKLFRVKED